MSLKRASRIAALLLLFVAAIGWLAAGAHRGWTRTRVPVPIIDEVTGLEGIQYQKRFVPGIDLLALSLAGAGLLAGFSFLVSEQPQKSP